MIFKGALRRIAKFPRKSQRNSNRLPTDTEVVVDSFFEGHLDVGVKRIQLFLIDFFAVRVSPASYLHPARTECATAAAVDRPK
jgi:hypothetical protein